MSNKFGAVKIFIDGHRFDSKIEGKRYDQLKLLARCGQIKGLEIQPEFVLQDAFMRDGKKVLAIKYRGDFSYIENGHRVVEDVKGHTTKDYLIKKKLFYRRYPEIEFIEKKPEEI